MDFDRFTYFTCLILQHSYKLAMILVRNARFSTIVSCVVVKLSLVFNSFDQKEHFFLTLQLQRQLQKLRQLLYE